MNDGDPRILVIRRRYVGDAVLTQAFIRNLRAAYPRARISVVMDEGFEEILAESPDIDRILVLPRGKRSSLPGRLGLWGRYLGAFAGPAYDVAFDLARNERALLPMLLGRARRRVSWEMSATRWRQRRHYSDLLTITREEIESAHIVDLNNRLLELVGIPTPERVPRLPVSAGARQRARAMIRTRCPEIADGDFVLMHVGGGAIPKLWPPAKFAAIADRIQTDLDRRVLVVAGPGEGQLTGEVLDRMHSGGCSLGEVTSFPVLYGLLAEADYVIANDTGPSHMGAAVGTPVCVVFGAQSTTMWHPLGEGHEYVVPPLPCGEACVMPGSCDGDDPIKMYCVRRVEAEQVNEAVDRIEARLRSGIADRRSGRATTTEN
jgi:ADP-heptose:LPS heptosyltransferase